MDFELSKNRKQEKESSCLLLPKKTMDATRLDTGYVKHGKTMTELSNAISENREKERTSFSFDPEADGNKRSITRLKVNKSNVKNRRTLLVTSITLILTIACIFLAYLIVVKPTKSKAIAESVHSICLDRCSINIAETIPDNVIFGPSEAHHPKIVEELKSILVSAKTSIDIASSYWTLQEGDVKGGPYRMAVVGQHIFDEIKHAANKYGVKVRIVHQVFCKNGKCQFPNNDTEELSKLKNIEVRTLDIKRLLGAGIIHTKMLLVDGKQIYIGSANFDWRSYTEVKELGLITRECGCLGADMKKIFDAYWYLADKNSKIPNPWPTSFDTKYNKDNPLRIVKVDVKSEIFLGSSPQQFCPSSRTSDIEAILHIIHTARKFIFIAVMDYLTAVIYTKKKSYWSVIDNALRSAAYDRGIDVKLLASNWTHTKPEMVAMLKSLQDFGNACNNGRINVKLFSIPKGSIEIPFTRVNHNKYMVTETTAYVGTSNWVGDYFINTAGIGFVVSQQMINSNYSHASVQDDLRDVFERDWNSKYAIAI